MPCLTIVFGVNIYCSKTTCKTWFIIETEVKTVHDSSVSGFGLSRSVLHCLYKKMTCTRKCFPQAIAHKTQCLDFYIFIFDTYVYLLTMITFV